MIWGGRAFLLLSVWVGAAGPANAADTLETCLVQADRKCIVELVLAGALAKPDPLDRIAALVTLANLLALDDDTNAGLELLGFADATMVQLPEPEMQDEARFLIAEGRARAGDFAGALAVTEQIEEPGRRAFALSTIAVTAGEAGALAFLEPLLPTLNDQLADEVKEDLAEHFAAAGEWDRLIELCKTLVFWTPDLARWVLADVAAVRGLDDALRLYELVPLPLKDFGARGLVDGFVRLGNLAIAQQLALAVRGPYHSDSALAEVAEAAARAGDMAFANAIIVGILDGETKGDALVKLAGVLAEKGDSAGAFAIAQQVVTAPPPTRTPAAAQRLPQLVYAAIAQALADRGDVAGALAAIARISDRGEHDAALGAMVARRLDRGDAPGALLALDQLLGGPSLTPPASLNLLRDSVRDLARVQQTARAIALAQALPEGADRTLTLSRAAAAVINRPEAARQLVDAAAQGLGAIAPNRREAAAARIAVLRARARESVTAAALLRDLGEDKRTEALLAIAFPEFQPLP